MNLFIPQINLDIPLHENQIDVLTLENPSLYRTVISDIWQQTSGRESSIRLYENDKQFALSKYVELLFNPITINCNDRRILTKLYSELSAISYDQIINQTTEMTSCLIAYMDELLSLSSYSLTYSPDVDIASLLKVLDLHLQTDNDSVLEKLIDYIRAVSLILHKWLFVCINLKAYLVAEELLQLYESANYQKVHLLLVESVQHPSLPQESQIIVDRNLCIINETD